MAKTSIKRVTLKHIDRQTPSNISEQGTLSEARNIRYNKFGIENVCDFTIEESIHQTNNFTIVYVHSGRYLATDVENKLHHVEIILGTITSKSIITNITSGVDISNFGKVLYLTNMNSQQIFLYTEETYKEFKINQITPLDNVKIEYTYKVASNTTGYDGCYVYGYTSIIKSTKEYILKLGEVRAADYIPGVFYIMFAYRLFDGSIIKPSRAYMVANADSFTGCYEFRRKEDITFSDGIKYDYGYSFPISGSQVELNIKYDTGLIDSDLVRSIVIYATRPEQEFDYDRSHEIFEVSPQSSLDYYKRVPVSYFRHKNTSEYPSKPFFEIEELLLSSGTDGTLTKKLTWSEHFEYIEHGAVFEPTFTVHDKIHRNIFEYNGRLHSFNQTTTIYNGVNLLYTEALSGNSQRTPLPDGYTIHIETTLRIDDRIITVKSEDIKFYYRFLAVRPVGNYNFIAFDNFISYPDHRAEVISIYLVKSGLRRRLISMPLISCLENNFAYHMRDADRTISEVGELSFPEFDSFTPNSGSFKQCEPILNRNKIMVSMVNNPFAFEPRHTYNIEGEDCVIHALTTAVSGLTEESYGTHPLLVFTNQGLYALEQGGGDVLYSQVVLIDNSDKYRVNDVVSLSSIVFFVSQDEVMATTSRITKSVSEIIYPSNNSPVERSEFKRYIQGARPYALIWYNEIMIYNEIFNYAYIYSVESNCWSTRDLTASHVSNSIIRVNNNLVSLSKKENHNYKLPISLKTNTITLGNDGAKKIEYLELLFSTSISMSINTTIYASNNLLEWYEIGSSIYGQKIGRMGATWRYYKVSVTTSNETETGNQIYLWGIDIKSTSKYKGIVE